MMVREKKAVDTLERLVLLVMQNGGFKTFEALDECREAVETLKIKINAESKKGGCSQKSSEESGEAAAEKSGAPGTV